MLLSAKNLSNADLQIFNFKSLYKMKTKGDWMALEFHGSPNLDSSAGENLPPSSKFCWFSSDAALSAAKELKFSFQYKTEHFNTDFVAWNTVSYVW